jgi:hypothetical protein
MRLIKLVTSITVAIALTGCDRSPGGGGTSGGGGAGAGPFGAANTNVPIMKPFDGDWRFSAAKTLAQWQADGVPAGEIAEAKKLAQSFPLHPDMSLTGDTAVLSAAPLVGEYKFFALHPHGPWVCGKGWHHEDRNDPGDMSKVLARLQLNDAGDLLLALRLEDNAPTQNDPDLTNMPVTAGSAQTCGADTAPEPPWSPWRTYAFERVKGK